MHFGLHLNICTVRVIQIYKVTSFCTKILIVIIFLFILFENFFKIYLKIYHTQFYMFSTINYIIINLECHQKEDKRHTSTSSSSVTSTPENQLPPVT